MSESESIAGLEPLEPPVHAPIPSLIPVDPVDPVDAPVPPPEQTDDPVVVVHFDAPVDSPITRVLLIDRRITKYDEIIASMNENTACVIFDYDADTFETLRTNGMNRIAPDNRVVCGSDERPTIVGYSPGDDVAYDPLLNLGFALPLQYLGIMQHRADGERYFATANETGCQLKNVAETDPMLKTWANYIAFLIACKRDYGVETYDIMACSTYSDPDWKYVINEMEARCDVVIRSSLDDTGSAKLGGNWFLLAGGSSTTTPSASATTAAEAETETETVDLTAIYFTDEILKYEFSLGPSYGSNVFVMVATGSAYCWGRNAQGQLHPVITDTINVKLPIRWSSLTNVIASAQTAYNVVALTADGYVYTSGQEGQNLGPGRTTETARIPTAITGYFGTVMQISCGYTFTMILLHTGIVGGWGDNTSGQISGTGSTTPQYISYMQPVFGNNGITNSDFVSISCGGYHVAALKSNGWVYMWGSNSAGECGRGNTSATAAINTHDTSIFSAPPIVQVSASNGNTVIVGSNGSVYGCGYAFANSTPGYWITITTAFSARYVVNALSNDNQDTALLMSDGTIWTMNAYISTFSKTVGIENAIAITGTTMIAITTNGSVYSWGGNNDYRLGNGTTVATTRPSKIMNLVGMGVNAMTLGGSSGGFYSGIITTIAARAALSTMLNLNTASLLFRYVGVPQSDFNTKYHAAVDNHRALLFVVKSTTGAVALGYFGPMTPYQSTSTPVVVPAQVGQAWTCPFMAPDASGNTLSTVKYYNTVHPENSVMNFASTYGLYLGNGEIRVEGSGSSVGNSASAGSEVFETPPNGLLGNGTGVKTFTVSAIEVFYAPQIYGAFNATTATGTSKNLITSTAATTMLATMVEASSMRLLFKSTTLSIADFHAACDGAGSTLLVIKATNGAVALAYSSVSWNNTSEYIAADRGTCWLYPFMAPDVSGNTVNSLRYYNVLGPTSSIYSTGEGIAFGGGHDLYMDAAGNISMYGYTYQSPPNGLFGNGTGYKTGFLAGIEVYSAVSIGFSQSIITSVDGITAANTMVKNPRLLYKSSGPTYSYPEYHAACDYKGSMLFVIKSSGGAIVMAYAADGPLDNWTRAPYTCWLCPFQASTTSPPKTVKYYNTSADAVYIAVNSGIIGFGYGHNLNLGSSFYEKNYTGVFHEGNGGYETRPNGLFETGAAGVDNTSYTFTLAELEIYAADPAETVFATCGLRGPYGPTLDNTIATYGKTTTNISTPKSITSYIAKYVSVGGGTNSIVYSYDGITWTGSTNSTSIFSTDGRSVAYSTQLSRWVAVGEGTVNTIAYSADGIAWTGLGKSIFSSRGWGVAYSAQLSRWVAVGEGTANSIAYSSDGITWTGIGSSIFSTYAFGVAYSAQLSRWVAVGRGTNTIAYSTDGITWTGSTNSTSIFTSGGYGVAYSAQLNRWVAVGYGTNTIAYSSDGITWTVSTNSTSTFSIYGIGVAYSVELNRWVAVGLGTNTIAYSNDGITWTGLGTSIFTTYGYGIAYSSELSRWVAVGEGTNAIAYSTDGITWTGSGSYGFSSYGWDVAAAISSPPTLGIPQPSSYIAKYVSVGQGTTNSIAYSYDGTTWTGLGTSIFSSAGRSIAYSAEQNRWVAVGTGTNSIAYSTDGITWTGLGTSIFSEYGNGIAYSAELNRWVAVGYGTTNTIAYSTDGITWTGIGSSIFSSAGNDVAYSAELNRWVAVGGGTNAIAYSTDGITWTGLGTSIFSTYGLDVAYSAELNRWVAVGYGTNTIAYSADGITWTGIGTSIFSDYGFGVAYSAASISSPSTSGVQQWIVPSTGTYSFRVCGGTGAGALVGADNVLMKPAFSGFVNVKFRLTVGQVLRFICGQRAAFKVRNNGNQYNGGGGGGGGTFVIDALTGTLLIASGGGGGAGIQASSFTPPNVEADVYARVWTYSTSGGAFNYTHDAATWGTQRISVNGESGSVFQNMGSLTNANVQLVGGYSSIGWADMYKNGTFRANGASGGGIWADSYGGFGGGGAPYDNNGAGGGGWCGGNAAYMFNGYWGGGYGASYINTGWVDYVSTGDTSVVSTSPNGYVQIIRLLISQLAVTLGFTQTVFVVKYVLNSTFTIPAGIINTNNADASYVVTHTSQSGVATITNSANVGTATVLAKGTTTVSSSIGATENYAETTVSLITIVVVGSGTTYSSLSMISADLSGADLTGSVFSGSCNLTGANLYGATVSPTTDLSTATLTGVKSGRIVGGFTTLLPAGYKMI